MADNNHTHDVFLADVVTGAITRLSKASTGMEGNSSSLRPSISADGNTVAYESHADNLVPNDTNLRYDVLCL